jgi:hypothetical protein
MKLSKPSDLDDQYRRTDDSGGESVQYSTLFACWLAQIRTADNITFLGRFATAAEAAEAFDLAMEDIG